MAASNFSYTNVPLQSVEYYQGKLTEAKKRHTSCETQCATCDGAKNKMIEELTSLLKQAKVKVNV